MKRPVERPMKRRLSIPVAAAVVGMLVLSGCEFSGLYDLPLPGGAARGDAYRVSVEFADVLDLVPQSAVKVNDVTVGAVEQVSLDGWHARVRLRVSDDVRLPDNAIAELRQTSLLGEKFVSLAEPRDAKPTGVLSDGDLIPLARSGRNPEVEEVLSALSLLLNGGGVAQLKTINVELGNVLAGREDRIRALLGRLDTFVGSLDAQRAQIVRAIDSIDRLARTLRSQQATIAAALDVLGPGLKVLADQRAQLTKMLTALADLGAVGTRVVRKSTADTVADLRALVPILTRLNQAGTALPQALELLVTYPFPRNITDAVKGDYTNLRITADLDIASLYQNLLAGPGSGAGASGPGRRGGGAIPQPPPGCLPAVGCAKLPQPPPPQLPPLPTLPKVPVPKLPLQCPTLPPLPAPLPAPLPTSLPVPVPSGCPTPTPTPPPGGGAGGPLCPPVCLSSAAVSAGRVDDGLASLLAGGLMAGSGT